jgi:hypothetical protein
MSKPLGPILEKNSGGREGSWISLKGEGEEITNH